MTFFKCETRRVNKKNYVVYEYLNGYFGICKKNTHGANPVFEGVSAWESSYDKDSIVEVFENWDGTLTRDGDDDGIGEDGYRII